MDDHACPWRPFGGHGLDSLVGVAGGHLPRLIEVFRGLSHPTGVSDLALGTFVPPRSGALVEGCCGRSQPTRSLGARPTLGGNRVPHALRGDAAPARRRGAPRPGREAVGGRQLRLCDRSRRRPVWGSGGRHVDGGNYWPCPAVGSGRVVGLYNYIATVWFEVNNSPV